MRIKLARKAKVRELDVARSIQNQVFRLEISVSEALRISFSYAQQGLWQCHQELRGCYQYC